MKNKKTARSLKDGARKRASSLPPVRYALVGLGHIAQAAVLPAFKHAPHAQLAALVSGNPAKLRQLGRRYNLKAQYPYEQFEECLSNEGIEAVYIALPNSMHTEFAVRAAESGVHVLCEKPLAVSVQDCLRMIESAQRNSVHLMTAYRLHFDPVNMRVVDLIKRKKIGEPLAFHSFFSYQIKDRNTRLQGELGGGALFDIGIYCINAARYLFQSEPISVFAEFVHDQDERFREVEGTCSALMRFPRDRLAQFTCSFAGEPSSYYDVLGSKGRICVDPAYEYAEALEFNLTVNEKTKHFKFKRSDQFAAELEYFAKCIREQREPEPSGWEGLADVRIIEALRASARLGVAIQLEPLDKTERPDASQAIQRRPLITEPPLVQAESASD